MRLRYLIPPLLLCLVAAGAVTAHAASDRQASFSTAATQLRAQWDDDQAQGVPASSLAPLRTELTSQEPTAAWWSPAWLGDNGQPLLARLRSRTAAAWSAAIDAQRSQAQAVITQWNEFAQKQTTWLTSNAVASAGQWSRQLNASTTPAAITSLTTSWKTFLSDQQTAVVAAQQAKLADALKSAGGPHAVLASARHLVAVAASANLDAGNVELLATQLSDQIAAGDNLRALATGEQLLPALSSLQGLVNLNNQVSGQVLPLLWNVDQAEAEGTPHAAALAAQQSGIGAQFGAARTADQLNAVAASVAALQGQIGADLTANQCGHAVGAGKVITISLSLQEMVFYQDGCVVKATPVTTGRPQLRTPAGHFAVFSKPSNFTFISPWPKGSPFYYNPTPARWGLEFAAGGYFIHDASWESTSSYGPGGENNQQAASHGCVHTPTPIMEWAFSWTPIGTPVVITA
ncbi:MAG: L,D-transpeptidase [Candidatus Dormibacteraeota bacterium]|uniref:L,D-transpeptidase n=1 Tax=Candidatus Aeolococcus gillhamiae TaxID=3127015 RepID=A0A934K403_9BACT|nr:L,D-transpeptidase [Candidatus Dormibacteraeota bacterium]